MGDGKRKDAAGRGPGSRSRAEAITRKATRPAARGRPAALEAYDNSWEAVSPGTMEDVRAVEAELGVELPLELARFLMTCGGGRPARGFFAGEGSEVFELGVGYVLPLRDEPRKDGVATTCRAYRDAQHMPVELVPFALDRGHANPICVRLPGREVVYWLHDEPDDRVRYVAASLEQLLSGLGECPF